MGAGWPEPQRAVTSAIAAAAIAAVTMTLSAAAAPDPAPSTASGRSAPGEPPAAPLTNEDIVKMAATGMGAEEILARIASLPSRFDVDPDILEELRLAGVPETVIDAMKRMARAPPSAKPAPPAEGAAPGFIEIVFDVESGSPPERSSFVAPAAARDSEGGIARRLELVFFVTCTRPLHVPDQWDRASPMGAELGRHQMLLFREGTTPVPRVKKKADGFVYLALPPRVRFSAEAGVHAGRIGVAARLEGDDRFGDVLDARYDSLTVEPGRLSRIEVRIRSGMGKKGMGRAAGGEVALPDSSMTSLTRALRQGPGLRATIEILRLGPPEPAGPLEEAPQPEARPRPEEPPS